MPIFQLKPSLERNTQLKSHIMLFAHYQQCKQKVQCSVLHYILPHCFDVNYDTNDIIVRNGCSLFNINTFFV